MAVKTYDPKSVNITFAGIPVEGFADGTFITVARDNPGWNKQIGSDGEGVRAKSNDRGGTMTVTLMQSSATNDAFSALALIDENSGNGVGPFLMRDASGRTICAAETAWIEKFADASFAREAETREWTIATDVLIMTVGGN